jgi:hypothetical protein
VHAIKPVKTGQARPKPKKSGWFAQFKNKLEIFRKKFKNVLKEIRTMILLVKTTSLCH